MHAKPLLHHVRGGRDLAQYYEPPIGARGQFHAYARAFHGAEIGADKSAHTAPDVLAYLLTIYRAYTSWIQCVRLVGRGTGGWEWGGGD